MQAGAKKSGLQSVMFAASLSLTLSEIKSAADALTRRPSQKRTRRVRAVFSVN
jgi:hypothetical protein